MSWIATAQFYDNLRRLLLAGMTMSEALDSSASTSRGPYKAWATQWAQHCQNGDALGPQLPEAYPVAKALITAGEGSGRMPELCKTISDFYEQCHQTRMEMIGKSIYPIFLFHFATIVPIGVFSYMGAMPPWAAAVGPSVFWGTALLLFIFYKLNKNSTWFHQLLLAPPFGLVIKPFATYMMCLVLEACVNAGMKYPESLRETAKSTPNLVMRNLLNEGADLIEAEKLSSCAAAVGRLPIHKTVKDLCENGERSGKLEESLQRCIVFERERYNSALKWAAKTVNAIIYTIAIIVAVIVIIAGFGAYVGMLNSIKSPLG